MTQTSTKFLRALAALLLLTSLACKKLPVMIPCECEPDPPSGQKGHLPSQLAVCGTLHIYVDSTQPGGTMVIAFLGFNALGQYNLAELAPNKTLGFGGNERIWVSSVGYRFSIDGTVSDLNHNPLVALQGNYWYVYRNNIGKYNYDAQGLEVYDKLGHIVLSIDGLTARSAYPNSSMNIQGIIPRTDTTVGYYKLGDMSSYYNWYYGTPELNKAIYHLYDSIPIQPLFRYTGPNWQHARL